MKKDLPRLSVSSLRGLFEVRDVALVLHLFRLTFYSALPLHACFD